MPDDEGVEPGTPEFEAAAMEGLMTNLSLPWADRVACGQKAITILRGLLADAKQSIPEIDRHARAYGFEVGRGTGLVPMLTASDDNPFMDPNWQEGIGPATLVWSAGPRTWELPAEPGPEVTAVRTSAGSWYGRTTGNMWQQETHISAFTWAEILAWGPLTDATGEVEDGG